MAKGSENRRSLRQKARRSVDAKFSQALMDDMIMSLQATLARRGIVNIPKLAEEIRQRNEAENVALEDIAAHLLQKAQSYNAAMEFDTGDSLSAAAS